MCCAKCIVKIKRKGKGQHTDCKIFNIEEIKEEKKNALSKNISLLESLSKTLEETLKDLKIAFEKIDQSKEEIRLKVQKTFTKIRNLLNDREDEILLKINNYFINENIIKEGEKLPNKIKLSLEKGKKINNEWDNEDKLNILINDCLNIENNINEINNLNEEIKKFNDVNYSNIIFFPEKEEEMKNITEIINHFGDIIFYSNYKFKRCPKNTNIYRTFTISGENENIFTKTGKNENYSGTIGQSELKKKGVHKWKIKILKTKEYYIKIGIATNDFDHNNPFSDRCGWYYFCQNGSLYSGPPHKLDNKQTNLGKKKDEIIVIMNMERRSLKFIINGEDKGESINDIPIDKPIFPAVLLYHVNDSLQIIRC